MNKRELQKAKEILQGGQRIMVASHVRADGDAVGSVLGLGLALQEAGKEVHMILADGVPKSFRHLYGSDQIKKKPDGEYDTIILLDCSDLDRAGEAISDYPTPDLNIDHHITNLYFAKINLVDQKATATAEILAAYLPDWGFPITKPVAEALLTGIITDTLGFRTTNIRSNALRVAADLLEIGIDMSALYRKALDTRSLQSIRYWGAGLKSVQLSNRIIWATLTLEARKEINYPGRDDADLINILTTIEEADIALIFVEQPNDYVKVSWRARPGFDVAQIAMQFGGGGHKPAAGATIAGNLEEVQAKVLKSTYQLFNGDNRSGH